MQIIKRTITIILDPKAAHETKSVTDWAGRLFWPDTVEVTYENDRRYVAISGPKVTAIGGSHSTQRAAWSISGDPDESWPTVAVAALRLVESTSDGDG